MWSSAIFLAACLSTVFANPVALLNVRTAQDPSNFFFTSDDIPKTGFSTPGLSDIIHAGPAVPVLTPAVGNSDWGKVSSSDFDGVYFVPEPSSMVDSKAISLGSTFNNEYTAQPSTNFYAPNQYQENPPIPNEKSVFTLGPSGDLARFSDNLVAETQITPCQVPTFVPVHVDWKESGSHQFQVNFNPDSSHLYYPPKNADCGGKSFMCMVEDLACCGSYGTLEGKIAAERPVFLQTKCGKYDEHHPCPFDEVYSPTYRFGSEYTMSPRCRLVRDLQSPICNN